VGIADFEDGFDDFRDSKYRSNSTGFNADVGAAASFFDDTLTIGLAGRNLLEHELRTVASGSTPAFTHHIGPTFTTGVALNLGGTTLAADVDVTEIDRFKDDDESRFANVGAEFKLFGWMQFRAGYQTDIEDTVDDMITAGVGLSPFDLFHVDLAAVYGEGDTYGAMLQFWITF
ncbi:MAG: conjugal transfer protein TraF, partial [Planctomycetota bacterium]|nr:conjugal transfer protein TraF [Planctomycetota bacterium]